MGEAPVRLQMQKLSKRFGATVALDQVSLSVNSGEVLALVGENGAGKSTYFNLLSGTFPPSSGKVEFEGRDVTILGPPDDDGALGDHVTAEGLLREVLGKSGNVPAVANNRM